MIQPGVDKAIRDAVIPVRISKISEESTEYIDFQKPDRTAEGCKDNKNHHEEIPLQLQFSLFYFWSLDEQPYEHDCHDHQRDDHHNQFCTGNVIGHDRSAVRHGTEILHRERSHSLRQNHTVRYSDGDPEAGYDRREKYPPPEQEAD